MGGGRPTVDPPCADGHPAETRKRPWSDNPGVDRTVRARAQALLIGLAGVLGAFALLLPHPARFHEEWLLVVQAGCVVHGIVLWWCARRWAIPEWVLRVTPPAGVVFNCLAIVLSGDGASA